MKIQFGCGKNKLEGWQNHDRDVDITTRRLPYPDRTATMIFAEHVLEHVSGPQGFNFIKECYRLLQIGGTLRLCVPELKRLELLHRAEIISLHGHQMVYCEENLRLILETAGFDPSNIHVTSRRECDSHWRTIGLDKDDLETLRIEAIK